MTLQRYSQASYCQFHQTWLLVGNHFWKKWKWKSNLHGKWPVKTAVYEIVNHFYAMSAQYMQTKWYHDTWHQSLLSKSLSATAKQLQVKGKAKGFCIFYFFLAGGKPPTSNWAVHNITHKVHGISYLQDFYITKTVEDFSSETKSIYKTQIKNCYIQCVT